MTTRIPFKLTVSEQAFGLDVNDFAAANGLAPVFATDPNNAGAVLLTSPVFARLDSGLIAARVDIIGDVAAAASPPVLLSFLETLPDLGSGPFARGNDINADVTQQIDGAEDELYSQIKGWFGLPQTGTSWPVCSGVTKWAAPTNAGYPGRGGQTYPMTPRGSVLIDPPPADWFRE